MLIAAAIAAIAIAAFHAFDHYRKSTQGPSIDPCIANLKMIAGAKATRALDHRKPTNAVPVWADLVGSDAYFRDQPTCHMGGTYTLGAVGQKPTCTAAGHSLER
jgi:hypothetical protein